MEKEKDIIEIDPGHMYLIPALNVNEHDEPYKHGVLIRFVKRIGRKYPGNKNEAFPNAYPGITMQGNLRGIISRLDYVDKQHSCIENKFISLFLKLAIWFLEFRAARHNKIFYFKSLNFAYKSKMCVKCGHTVCNHV